MKVLVGAFNQEKALVGAFSVIVQPVVKPMEHYTALVTFCLAQAPERILDAPDIGNDYYLHLVDWSSHNHLAVALGAHIYLWNAATGEIVQLCQLEAEDEVVTSVKWAREGSYLAVGSSTGAVQLWDVASMKR